MKGHLYDLVMPCIFLAWRPASIAARACSKPKVFCSRILALEECEQECGRVPTASKVEVMYLSCEGSTRYRVVCLGRTLYIKSESTPLVVSTPLLRGICCVTRSLPQVLLCAVSGVCQFKATMQLFDTGFLHLLVWVLLYSDLNSVGNCPRPADHEIESSLCKCSMHSPLSLTD